MRLPLREERRVDEEAAAWLEILNRGGAAEREAFAAWAKESPTHVRAFLLMTALDVELAGVDAEKRNDIHVESAQVVPLHQDVARPTKPPKEFPRTRLLPWAAGLAAVAVIGFSLSLLTPRQYATEVGEQRTLDMPDGSVVFLNTDSKVSLEFSKEIREIRLVNGEALFKVARDPSRPFQVRTDDAVILAVGTQFNVRQDAHGTKVAVIEGQIKVGGQEMPLAAGEGATIEREGRVVNRAPAEVERTLAWRQRRLMFRTDTLADIAAEFNRYNRSPQIRIGAEALSARRFSGVFDADDPESFAQVLEGSDGLSVERTASELVIRAR